jgi:hypothetical protein
MSPSSKPGSTTRRPSTPRTFCALRYDDAVAEADQSDGTVWKCIEWRCEALSVGKHAHAKRAYLVWRKDGK